MSNHRQSLGKRGEAYAADYLTAHGSVIRDRNWHCPLGELDLVTERDGQVIFVEVRTRQTDRLGTPEESITPAKRAKLIAAAQTYLDEYDQLDREWRIDVVAIEVGLRGEVTRCTLIENAIEEI
jgi:putative endonuclease